MMVLILSIMIGNTISISDLNITPRILIILRTTRTIAAKRCVFIHNDKKKTNHGVGYNYHLRCSYIMHFCGD